MIPKILLIVIIKLFVTLYCDEYTNMTNTTYNFLNQTHKNGNEQPKNLNITMTCHVFWNSRSSHVIKNQKLNDLLCVILVEMWKCFFLFFTDSTETTFRNATHWQIIKNYTFQSSWHYYYNWSSSWIKKYSDSV